jgi:hypothetical protein
MSRKLQAYFQTEDEAMSVKDQLIKYNATNVEIGYLEDNGSEDRIPLAVPIVTGGTSYVNNGVMAPNPVSAAAAMGQGQEDQFNIYRSVLSGEISEGSYDEAVDLILSNGGHIEEDEE